MDPKFKITSGLLKAYKSEDGVRRLRTTASSTILDHGKDRMLASAIEKMAQSAKNNMTLFLNHSYTVPEDVFASVEDVAIRNAGSGPDGTIYDLDFEARVNEANPRAVSTWEAINGGTKLGTSIGAIVKDYDKNQEGGWDISDVELLEASIVGIPANPRSWVHYARKSIAEAIAADGDEGEPTIDAAVDTEPLDTADATEDAVEKAMCPGCNKSESDCSCPDGCTCGKKDIEPAVVKLDEAAEADEDEDDEEPSAQEAPADPETAIEAEPSEAKDLTPDPITFKAVLDQIEGFAQKVIELEEELVKERDAHKDTREALDAALANLNVAKEIVDKLSDLPLPRKARQQAVDEFHARLGSVYTEDFLKMLE